MVSPPAETPVTTPPTTVALALPVLHEPPKVPSVKVMIEPIHTLELPEMVPALGNGLTVTVEVAVAVPQLLVTT